MIYLYFASHLVDENLNSSTTTMFFCSYQYPDPEYISLTWVCDGYIECTSGEDEADCGKTPYHKT